MSPTTTTVEVERSAEDVFTYAIDPTRFPEWQEGVVEGHMDHTGTPEVGSLCHTTRRIAGARRPSTSEVTHIAPPKSWGVRGIDGPIRAIVDLTVEPVTNRRSRLSIAVDFTGHGVGKVLVPLIVRREARKEMPRNLEALKKRLEGSRAAAE